MKFWRSEFPELVSYTRFVEYIPSVLAPLMMFLRSRCLGHCTGISFIDSTSLDVSLSQSIHVHKAFTRLAQSLKPPWLFFGIKLLLVINDRGEIPQFCISPGNVEDSKPVPQFAKKLFGKLFSDISYISHSLVQSLTSWARK